MRYYLWEMRPYFRQVAGQLVLGSIAGIIMNTAVVLPAILLGRAIDAARAFGRGEVGAGAVGWAALAFVGGTLLTEVPRIVKRWWLMTANARIRANIRADAWRGVIAWPMARLDSTPTGDVMARIIGDVEVLGVGVREFTIETWDTILFSLSLMVAMLVYDLHLTVLALLPVPVAMLLAKATGRWVASRTTTSREASASLTTALQEQLAGIRVLRLFGRTGAAVERVDTLSGEQADTNLALVRLRGGLRPVYTTLMTAGVLFVVWQGGEKTVNGAMTVGAFIAYLELYLRFVNRGFRVPQMINSIQGGAAAYARLRPLLAPPPPLSSEPPGASFRAGHLVGMQEPAPAPPAVPTGAVAVALHGVTLRYSTATAPALRDIWLDIPAGALVAVTGPVGAGKSAMARALLGLYPLEAGQVLLDGRALEAIPVAERAARTGYLPQDPSLFSGTIRDNILLGSATLRQAQDHAPDGVRSHPILASAVSCAALVEDLRTFPAGLETEIGELGVRVSGGQRQRIALARALVASGRLAPGLLILDDPFSALDLDTEAQIVAGLRQLFGPSQPYAQQCTVIMFSHRLLAFPQADLVVVLDCGRIREQGTHAELSASNGLYARIYRAQRLASTDSMTPRGTR
ncbi:MAG TPA: ABC transporter ATP-binding protein [Candidatus Saccharimonadia bacterium]|nr:ABC transporter ATP-binding protein [Candidatus Saccharimonadia bacterium]